ncbi:hybrid sensor histidine kinase/response regulator transcription factor [Planctobacterium marinum]|uniref:hybrid sensor histidine kinase/response regulator transcription factor n=1 Tax=Planctobacterium marinum TaxID=1631968 RepID=UPI001E4CEB16|nr:hybrid sensor histidine kinase/response regulator transcription factor [Planctobacterium marinum]MCC2604196.1 response regulator [Planctobacterium marinum]
MNIIEHDSTFWVGTTNGLVMLKPGERRIFNSYNGYTVANQVSGIAIDSRGTVWTSIIGGGVFYVNPVTMQHGMLQDITYLPHLNCSDIAKNDITDQLLIACNDTLFLFNIQDKELINLHERGLKKISVNTLAFEKSNSFLIGTWGEGVYRLDISKFKLDAVSTKPEQVNAITIGYNGEALVAGTNGAYVIEMSSKKLKKLSKKVNGLIWDEDVNTVFPLSTSDYLISFSAHGLHQYDVSHDQLKRPEHLFPLLLDSRFGDVNTISFADNKRYILVGAGEFGIYMLPYEHSFVSYFTGDDIRTSTISFLEKVGEQFFIADDNSLFTFDVTSNEVHLFLEGAGYTYFVEYYNNKFLVSTYEKGLFVLDETGTILDESIEVTGLPSTPQTNYSEILKLKNGNYLLGTDFGQEKGVYIGSFDTQFSKVIDDIVVIEMLEMENEQVLILTAYNGVFIYDLRQNSIINAPSPLENAFMDCIEQLRQDLFLICVRRNKAFLFDLESMSYQEFHPGTTEIRNVRTAEVDTFNNLWIASSRGLFLYDLESQDLSKITESEGIFSTEFSSDVSLMLNNEEIILPGNKGIVRIDTREAKAFFELKRRSKTETTITKLSYILSDHKGVSPNSKETLNSALNIPYDNIVLQIHLSHNNIFEEGRLKYETRLIGLSDEWEQLEVNKHSTSYTTLPPGEYQFQARIVDPRSNAIQPTTSLTINVTPPWWKTVWAYIAYLVLLVSLIYFISWYRNKKLLEINEQLTEKVRERTNTISKLLQQKQTFFANVSHEFRTPLALISGPLDAIAEKLKEPVSLNHVAVMRRNTARLQGLVDQILELAKFETSSSLPRQVYDLKASVEVIASSFSSLLEHNQQQLIINDIAPVRLKLIEDTLELVVSNLISNAIKYSGFGTEISVSANQDEQRVNLIISDNGKGISEENQELLFQRFTRFDAGENIPGSGIGLALVKQIVESNDGVIAVQSELGEGTTFTVSFQNNVAQDEAVTQVSQVQVLDSELNVTSPQSMDSAITGDKQQNSSENNSEKFKILVVEDNPDLRNFIVESLSEEYELDVAENGELGLKKAQDNIPDLILSDILMPVMDGYELSNAIRSDMATSHIPIILLTAKGDDLSRMRGWEEHVDDYLTKPFKLKELKLRISRLLTIRDILRKKHTSELHNSLATKNQEAISFQSKRDKEFFHRFEKVVEQHFKDEHFTRTQAASQLAMSERQLNRKLSALVDYNFSEYLRKYRLQKSRDLLLAGRQVTEVAYDVGFNSPSYFSSCFKAEFDKTPKRYVEELEQP